MAWVIDMQKMVKEDGYDDLTRTIVSGILEVAAVGAAAYNTAVAVRIATKEYKIGMKYWDLAENWLQYYKDFYAPLEDQELKEARNQKPEVPQYKMAQGRARASAWMKFKGLYDQTVRCTSRYCTGKRKDILETLTAAQAGGLALCEGMGYRNERAYMEARDDVRFKRMYETAKRGRNMAADPVSFGIAAAGIYGDVYQQAYDGLVGAGQFLGYMLNRQPTAYPRLRLRFDPAEITGWVRNRTPQTPSGQGG